MSPFNQHTSIIYWALLSTQTHCSNLTEHQTSYPSLCLMITIYGPGDQAPRHEISEISFVCEYASRDIGLFEGSDELHYFVLALHGYLYRPNVCYMHC